MSLENRKEWKVAAKSANKTADFRRLQREHTNLVAQRGPGLGVSPPHQTFFTKNSEAGNFMQRVHDKN